MNPDRLEYGDSYHDAVQGEMEDPLAYRTASTLRAKLYLPEVGPRDSVFEFGAGLGVNLATLRCGEKLAYDISSAARNRCEAEGIPFTDRLESVPEGRWDWVIAFHVLEHVPEPRGVLEWLRSRMKPDGRLILLLPEEGRSIPADLGRMDINQHLYAWTPRAIVNLLLHSGLDVISVRRFPLSMRSFCVRHGLVNAFPALSRLTDALRFGTCPGEYRVVARGS